jgi:hypothetical protein
MEKMFLKICVATLAMLVACGGCKKEDSQVVEKSGKCDITVFAVNGAAWTIDGTSITHVYPEGTTAGMLTPIITVSNGASVYPESGLARNFFADEGVTYTVTAEDGATKKIYTAKATITLRAECDVTAFSVDDRAWTIDGTNITCTYPAGTPTTTLTPAITVSTGATIDPASGVAQNFFTSTGVAYAVTAEDGKTKKTYTAKATVEPYTGCDITAFAVDGAAWTINGTNITYTYPPGTLPTTLVPAISMSPGATINPASGAARDFFTEAGISYTVTAEDGTTKKTYTAKATVATRTDCDITAFTVDGAAWTINGTNITYTYPAGTPAMMLTPAITVSTGATISPDSGVPQNFFTEAGVSYTVTAEDGATKKTYTVRATRAPHDDCEIAVFAVNGTSWRIDDTNITYTYPAGTPTTSLTPVIIVSTGATINPASGTAQNFFTSTGVTYTVTAEDGKTQKTYTARATVAARADCDITAFTVNGAAWTINGTNITYTFPAGTSPTTLTPTISVSPGATITPASGAAQNFFTSTGVSYTVTAEDGTTKKTYTAKATVAARTDCNITAFSVNGTAWTINGTDITYTYPAGTPALLLAPTITVSPGATISPVSGAAQNFFTSTGVSYTVTAEDGTTKKTYTAKARVAAHTDCDITAFTVNGTAWTINGTNITYTYPAGTPTTTLTPTISVSTGTTISPVSGAAQNFFTSAGVFYTVTAEDGTTKKTYTVKAIIAQSGLTGYCTWVLSGVAGDYTLTISGNGAMANYSSLDVVPWYHYRSEIKTLVVQEGVTAIGDYAFCTCSGFPSLDIPSSVTTIGNHAFYNCRGLTGTLTIGNSVTTIGSNAFYHCSGLTGMLTIPSSVTTIGDRAFIGCSGLTSVTNYRTTPQSIDSTVFSGVNTTAATLMVPSSAVNAYKSATGWKNFGTIVAIE